MPLISINDRQREHPLIEYAGEVSDAEKWRLLGEAPALFIRMLGPPRR